MGMFDNIDWTDPSQMAGLNFAASLMSSHQGLFPAIGGAFGVASQAAQTAQEAKAKKLALSQGIMQAQQSLAAMNHYRRVAGLPDLTMDDYFKGNYSLLPQNGASPSAPASPQGMPPNAMQPNGQPAPAPNATAPAGQPAPPSVQPQGDVLQPGIIAAIRTAESNNNPNAVSPKGALGPMQLMPATAANPGFGVQPVKDTSVAENDRMGGDYFKALQQRYGDPTTALIAYNWGPGHTDKWLAQGGDPSKLPVETQKYIAAVHSNMGAQGSTPVSRETLAQAPQGAPASQPQQSPIPSDLGLYDPAQALQIALKQEHTLTPEEAKAAGIPEGHVVQRDAYGNLQDVIKPDWMSDKAFQQQQQIWGVRLGNTGPDGKPLDNSNMVHYWAQSVAAGAPMPTLGMGPQAAILRKQILTEAANINMGQGLTGADQNAIVGTTKADMGALGKITQLRAATESYENTMLQNIALAKQMMDKGAGQYGAPVFNRWIRSAKKEYAGDPETAAFNTAVQSIKNEYAKIQSGSLGNAPVSDSSRREAEGMVDPNQTPQQLLANFEFMTNESGNRIRALRGQEGALKQGLSKKSDVPNIPGISEPQGANPAAANSTEALPPEAKKALKVGIVTRFANGQRWTLDASGNPKRVQ